MVFYHGQMVCVRLRLCHHNFFSHQNLYRYQTFYGTVFYPCQTVCVRLCLCHHNFFSPKLLFSPEPSSLFLKGLLNLLELPSFLSPPERSLLSKRGLSDLKDES